MSELRVWTASDVLNSRCGWNEALESCCKAQDACPASRLAAARAAALPPLNVSQRRWQPCENAHELAAATNGFYNSHCWA